MKIGHHRVSIHNKIVWFYLFLIYMLLQSLNDILLQLQLYLDFSLQAERNNKSKRPKHPCKAIYMYTHIAVVTVFVTGTIRFVIGPAIVRGESL